MCEKVASSDPFLLSGWVRKDASEIQPLGLGAFTEEAVPVGTHGAEEMMRGARVAIRGRQQDNRKPLAC